MPFPNAAQMRALSILVVVTSLVDDLITSCLDCFSCFHTGLLAPNQDTLVPACSPSCNWNASFGNKNLSLSFLTSFRGFLWLSGQSADSLAFHDPALFPHWPHHQASPGSLCPSYRVSASVIPPPCLVWSTPVHPSLLGCRDTALQ